MCVAVWSGCAILAVTRAFSDPIQSVPPPGGGCNASFHANTNSLGHDIVHFPSVSAQDCATRCCTLQHTRCISFTFTTYQPHSTVECQEGTACCWLKSTGGSSTLKANCTSGWVGTEPVPPPGPSPPPPSPPPIPGVKTPKLTKLRFIAKDVSGNLRDPSAVIQDPKTGLWHFWVVFMPGSTQPGWRGYLHHYVSLNTSVESTEWLSLGLALNHSSDPKAFDSGGMFSPSAVYDATGPRPGWYLFYSGTGANYTVTRASAQLVAFATDPDGPWIRLGLVAYPSNVNGTWNAVRTDSGRAQIVNGKRGYWTKGVSGKSLAQEGAYFPNDPSTFAPPYSQWSNNPVFKALKGTDGYENCEFFKGPDRFFHIICANHGGGQPHFVAPLGTDALNWTLANTINTQPALEPTPVYENGPPGDQADVNFFIARTETGQNGPGALAIAIYKLTWI